MIGQHLPNNNENATVPILQKKNASKPGLILECLRQYNNNRVPGHLY
jgi:hypothetical protein